MMPTTKRTRVMTVDLRGALQEIEVRGTGAFFYRFFLYATDDGDEYLATLEKVKAHIRRLIADGDMVLDYTDPKLNLSNFADEESNA